MSLFRIVLVPSERAPLGGMTVERVAIQVEAPDANAAESKARAAYGEMSRILSTHEQVTRWKRVDKRHEMAKPRRMKEYEDVEADARSILDTMRRRVRGNR